VSNFFHAHTHSRFSALDGMSSPADLAATAWEHGQPGLALTDHGNMAGVVQLYQACKKYGIKPYPGVEGYLIDPGVEDWQNPAKGQKVGRYHFGLMALTEEGYKGLVKFVSMTHTRPRFSRFPRASLNDLVTFGHEYGEHVALTTGCYFGLLQQTLVDPERGEEAARRVLEVYARAFPNTFVEVQDHHIDHPGGMKDNDIVKQLFHLADSLGLPVVATQDSHYHRQREKECHALMKRMVYSGSSDDEFPGDSFHLASTEWVQEHYTPEQWDVVEEGFGHLLDLHDLRITPLDDYRPDLPKVPGLPMGRIRKLCNEAMCRLGLDGDSEYVDRLLMELRVINKLGMAAYFVIVHDYVEWCRNNNIFVEARGSANGSLVCYLLGITQVDPVQWGTQFDRFLSEDRIKPPDIDMDVEDSDRHRLLAYLKRRYKSVQIGTWSRLGTSIDPETGEERGSVLVTWKQGKRRELERWALDKMEQENERRDGTGEKPMTKAEAMELAAGVFYKKYNNITDVSQVEGVSTRDYRALRQMLDMSVYRSYGVHAGGVLLSGAKVAVEDYVPTMLVASSDTTVTQFDMEDVEQLGLLKLDVLGQASLHTMRLTMELYGSADPTDFTFIPEDDPAACRILREGRPLNGIFHFEGKAKAYGGRKMGVRTTMDAILGSALFMPGAVDTGQTALYLERRKDRKARRAVTYLHPIFEEVLGETYGTVIFQEQVINIMRKLGMDIAGVNKFFKVVKDSGRGATERNAERLAEVRAQFDMLCARHDIDPDEAWAMTAGFVAYGFNRAHATGYGIRSYRFAYLKAHYPLQFMTALLQTWAGRDKEKAYIAEARRLRIPVLPADVNISGPSWTMDTANQAIRRGLVSIDGIGLTTAEHIAEHAPFASVEDMVTRVPPKAMTGGRRYLDLGEYTGVLEKLRQAGALDCLKGGG
jgi:DNA polymerase-3 subunit alpha